MAVSGLYSLAQQLRPKSFSRGGGGAVQMWNLVPLVWRYFKTSCGDTFCRGDVIGVNLYASKVLFPVVSCSFQLFPVVSARFRSFPLVSARFRSFPAVSARFRLFSPVSPKTARGVEQL